MAITFQGNQIACGDYHGQPMVASPKAETRRFFQFGTLGNTEIFGGRSGRPIRVDCWLSDPSFTSPTEVANYLERLDQFVGEHGALEIQANNSAGQYLYEKTFQNCTLQIVERQAPPGQAGFAILPDLIGGTVGPGSWWAPIALIFMQLSVDEV